MWLPHWHDAVEIVYLLEGELKVIVGNDSRILKAGQCAMETPNQIHFSVYQPQPGYCFSDSGGLYGKIHSPCKKFMFQPSGSGSLTCSAEQSGAF